MHLYYLGILLKCRFTISKFRVGRDSAFLTSSWVKLMLLTRGPYTGLQEPNVYDAVIWVLTLEGISTRLSILEAQSSGWQFEEVGTEKLAEHYAKKEDTADVKPLRWHSLWDKWRWSFLGDNEHLRHPAIRNESLNPTHTLTALYFNYTPTLFILSLMGLFFFPLNILI